MLYDSFIILRCELFSYTNSNYLNVIDFHICKSSILLCMNSEIYFHNSQGVSSHSENWSHVYFIFLGNEPHKIIVFI